MKCFTAGIVMAIVSQVAVSQNVTDPGTPELKHMTMAMPDGNGRLRMEAYNMDKDWAGAIVHLKGNVRVEIWATKNVREATILRANEADYSEKTGRISPRGDVRLTSKTQDN
jgi:lipopolysaccharide assembly outer membrane protein LptD (OstA)